MTPKSESALEQRMVPEEDNISLETNKIFLNFDVISFILYGMECKKTSAGMKIRLKLKKDVVLNKDTENNMDGPCGKRRRFTKNGNLDTDIQIQNERAEHSQTHNGKGGLNLAPTGHIKEACQMDDKTASGTDSANTNIPYSYNYRKLLSAGIVTLLKGYGAANKTLLK